MLAFLVGPLLIPLAYLVAPRLLSSSSMAALRGRWSAAVLLGLAVVPFALALVLAPFAAQRSLEWKRERRHHAERIGERWNERSQTRYTAVAVHDWMERAGIAVGYDTAVWVDSALLPALLLPSNAALVAALWTRRRAFAVVAHVAAAAVWLLLILAFT